MIDDVGRGRIQYKNLSSMDSFLKGENLFSFYCGVCGKLVLTTNIKLGNLPQRKTDQAIVLDLKSYFTRFYMDQAGQVVIKRPLGYEVKYRWQCECGVILAYQARDYFEQNKLLENQKTEEKCYIYIIRDALVTSQNLSKLIKEITNFRATQM